MARSPVFVALIASPFLLLAACSGGSSDTSPEGTSADSGTSAPETPANATFASLVGDAKRGEAAYSQCAACHSIKPGENRLGPSLHGVVGRKSGAAAGYNYSPANKESGLAWDGETLYTYLENPRKVMPGTKMSYSGMSDGQKRADLIAYLATLK